ncbi:hypothetical protein R1sor_011399 [Riccia sorocarpa]|uniref:DUF8039 domain-containing protein n=1 Tax=Riccia sorocarpa TaxID=122646 RepID=A0ABD3I0U6_9MARC
MNSGKTKMRSDLHTESPHPRENRGPYQAKQRKLTPEQYCRSRQHEYSPTPSDDFTGDDRYDDEPGEIDGSRDCATPTVSLQESDVRKYIRDDRKSLKEETANRSKGDCKPFSVEVNEHGQVKSGKFGKEKFYDYLKHTSLRLLDMTKLNARDDAAILNVKCQLDEKFEYIGETPIDMDWFATEATRVVRQARNKLHKQWVDAGSVRTSLCPDGIELAQWHKLIDYWRTPDFLKKSNSMKDARKCVKAVNPTGRSGHSGLLENMKRKRGSSPPLNEVQELLSARKNQQMERKEASISPTQKHSMGNNPSLAPQSTDAEGRDTLQASCLEGLSVSPEISSATRKLQDSLLREHELLKDQQADIKAEQVAIHATVNALGEKMNQMMAILMKNNSSDQDKGTPDRGRSPAVMPQDLSKISKDSATSRSPLHVGDELELRQVSDGRATVAYAKLMGLAGKGTYHTTEISPGFASVMILDIFSPDEPLPVPNKNDDPSQILLSDAAGSVILWPEKKNQKTKYETDRC